MWLNELGQLRVPRKHDCSYDVSTENQVDGKEGDRGKECQAMSAAEDVGKGPGHPLRNDQLVLENSNSGQPVDTSVKEVVISRHNAYAL